MDGHNPAPDYALRLEGVLCEYFKCVKSDVGIQRGDFGIQGDWKTSISFALGHMYGASNNAPSVKEAVENFRENLLDNGPPESIDDIAEANDIIEALEKILLHK